MSDGITIYEVFADLGDFKQIVVKNFQRPFFLTDTAVGAADDYLAEIKARLVQYIEAYDVTYEDWRLLIEQHVANGTSQRDFWRVRETLHASLGSFRTFGSPKSIVNIPHHGDTSFKGFDVGFATQKTAFVVSAKARADILDKFYNALTSFAGNVFSPDIALQMFEADLQLQVTVRVVTKIVCRSDGAPSMHSWAHTFVLWTGISPPVAVIEGLAFQSGSFAQWHLGGKNVENIRFQAGGDCRRRFNGRSAEGGRLRALPRYSLTTCFPFVRRCERLRNSARRCRWSRRDSRHREMGHKLHYTRLRA